MDTSIAVAIVAGVAAVVAPVLSWLAARQDFNDLRANIDRDIDLALRFADGSAAKERIERHISEELRELVVRERRGRSYRNIFGRLWLPVVYGLIGIGLRIEAGAEDFDRDSRLWFANLLLILAMVLIVFALVLPFIFKFVIDKRESRRSETEEA